MSFIVSDGTIVDIMPRSVDTDEKPKRATRKRATSSRARRTAPAAAVSEKTTARKRAPRKRAAQAAPPAEEKKVPKKVVTEGRKAPTSISATKAQRKAKRNQIIIVGVVMLIGVGASAAVGFTDDGRIDVNEAIEARNDRIRSGQAEDSQSVVVPVQNTNANQLPDGGLVGLGVGATPPPPPEPVATSSASSTASSTDEVASSTDSENIDEDEEVFEDSEESVEDILVENEELEEAVEPESETEVETADASEEGA